MSQTNATEQKANNPENLNLKPSLGARVKGGFLYIYHSVLSTFGYFAFFVLFCISVNAVSGIGGELMKWLN